VVTDGASLVAALCFLPRVFLISGGVVAQSASFLCSMCLRLNNEPSQITGSHIPLRPSIACPLKRVGYDTLSGKCAFPVIGSQLSEAKTERDLK